MGMSLEISTTQHIEKSLKLILSMSMDRPYRLVVGMNALSQEEAICEADEIMSLIKELNTQRSFILVKEEYEHQDDELFVGSIFVSASSNKIRRPSR